jgi:hypothetical protein
MRALRVVAGAAILLGTITACGSDDSAPSAGQPPTTSPSSTPSSTPTSGQGSPPASSAALPPPGGSTATGLPPGATPVPKTQVDTSGLADTGVPTEVAMTADGRILTLTVMARDACTGLEATITEETAEHVKVLVTPMLLPQGGPPDQVCAQVLTPRQVTVALKEPLGSRQLFVTEGY